MKRRNKLSKKQKYSIPLSFAEARRNWWDDFICVFPEQRLVWYKVNDDLEGTDKWWERLSNLQERL